MEDKLMNGLKLVEVYDVIAYDGEIYSIREEVDY